MQISEDPHPGSNDAMLHAAGAVSDRPSAGGWVLAVHRVGVYLQVS